MGQMVLKFSHNCNLKRNIYAVQVSFFWAVWLTTVTVIRIMKRTRSAMFCQSHDRGFSMLKLHGTLQQTQQVVTSKNKKSITVFRIWRKYNFAILMESNLAKSRQNSSGITFSWLSFNNKYNEYLTMVK